MSPKFHTRRVLSRRTGKAVAGYREIAASLRRRIYLSRWVPDEQLPPRRELEQEFGTSKVTMERALETLAGDGFIRAEPRRGYFVCRALPHVARYALIFPWAQADEVSQFYRAIQWAAGEMQSAAQQFTMFFDIHGHVDTEDYQRLAGFVQAHRLAGLIFASNPAGLAGSPLLEEPDIPRVAVMTGPDLACNLTTVYPDLEAFVPRAMDYLAGRGRHRVAIFGIVHRESPAALVHRYQQLAAAHGLTVWPQWVHGFHPLAVTWAQPVARSLLDLPAAQRPDAVIVTDDNLVPFATAGVAAAGLSGAAAVEVVAHTNFTWPTPAAMPVTRLGYDVRRLLTFCVERLEQQRRGEQAPLVTTLPPLFEEELGHGVDEMVGKPEQERVI